jgi:hypothetical protein
MNFIAVCIFTEKFLILLFAFRLFCKKSNLQQIDPIFIYWCLILLIDILIRLFQQNSTLGFNFFHIGIPPVIALLMLPIKIKLPLRLITTLMVIFISVKLNNFIFVSSFYELAILLLIQKGYNYSRKSSKYIKQSSVYFILAFDLIVSLIIYIMHFLNYNWYNSSYLIYFDSFANFVFTFNLFYVNVKFSRLVPR